MENLITRIFKSKSSLLASTRSRKVFFDEENSWESSTERAQSVDENVFNPLI